MSGAVIQTNIEDDLWINPAPAYVWYTNEANVPTPDTNSPVGDGMFTIPAPRTGPVFHL